VRTTGSRRQQGLTGSVAQLALLVVVGLAATACSDSGNPSELPTSSTNPTTTMVETRPSLAEEQAPAWIGEVVNLHDLGGDACFNQYSWFQDERLVEIDTRVPCEGPHQFEIYRRAQHPARQDAPWPGDREMEAFATAECYNAFSDFVGTIYELSELELGFLVPRQTDFEHEAAQFRGVHCYVFEGDGTDMVGTARGSLR